jgi:hypothetical protein
MRDFALCHLAVAPTRFVRVGHPLMNFRLFLVSLAAVFMLGVTGALAQEAVEPTAKSSPEETTTEPAPLPAEETPAPPKPSRHSKSSTSGEVSATRDVQDSMTAQEFKAAGLDKLSEQELKNLNAWLQGYRQKAETKAAEVAVTEAKKKSKSIFNGEAVLSRVADDNFAGVNGHSIIKLEDGTTWKQANPDDRFHAQVTNRPPAKVSHSTFGYKMHIVGVPEFYVDPVR